MLKVTVKFKDVQAEFLKKYPNGYIGHPGSGTAIDYDGSEHYFSGDKSKVEVQYSEGGKLYNYRPQNNLMLAHQLGLMENVGYANDYFQLKRSVEHAKDWLDNPEKNSFFGRRSIDVLTREYDEAVKAWEDFNAKYTSIA